MRCFARAESAGLVIRTFVDIVLAAERATRDTVDNVFGGKARLAVCDARTAAPDDLPPADGVYDAGDPPWMELEAFIVHHNSAHRWLYYRDMRPDEVLLFRSYDNLPTWRAGVPHSAFDDPSCPPGGAPRMSIEARVFVIYS